MYGFRVARAGCRGWQMVIALDLCYGMTDKQYVLVGDN
jgi:hypothetical protein